MDYLYVDVETSGLLPWAGHRICGIGIALNDGPAQYLPIRHTTPTQGELLRGEEPFNLDPADALARLAHLAESRRKTGEGCTLVGHNLSFDLNFLRAEGLVWDGPIWDTLVSVYLLDENRPSYALKALGQEFDPDASRLKDEVERYIHAHHLQQGGQPRYDWVPPEILGPYCLRDIGLTRKLHRAHQEAIAREGLEEVAEWDMELVKVLADIQWVGWRLDVQATEQLLAEAAGRMLECEQRARDLLGHAVRLSSPVIVRELLRQRGVDLPSLTAKGQESTAEAVLRSVDDPLAAIVLDYRGWRKVRGWCKGLLELARHDGRVHPHYNPAGYVTGRIACREPNLQGFPRPDAVHRERDLLIADEGYELWGFDYDQVELRLACNYAQDRAMLEAFQSGADFHAATAERMFGRVTPEYRSLAKRANFAMLYGAGAQGFAREWGLKVEEAERLLSLHRRTYSGLRRLSAAVARAAQERGWVRYWTGRRRHFPPEAVAAHKALQSLISGGCAEVMRRAMVRVWRLIRGRGAILGQIHDELILQLPEGEADVPDLVREIAAVMVDFPFEEPPLRVSVKRGRTWMRMEEVDLERI